MWQSNGHARGKKDDDVKPSGPKAVHTTYQPRKSRRRWMNGALLIWFLSSIYPVYVFWFDAPSEQPVQPVRIPAKPPATFTVTETVAVPALSRTALPNHLSDVQFNPNRVSDAIDTFRHYRQNENCTFSSLDLHGPFEPLCEDRRSLMRAMSEGGRIGVDAPYSPRGCDMRWFSNEEICEIMTRFEDILIIGDSMMRNVAVALHVLIRADLVNGGRTWWYPEPEGVDCQCGGPFETSKCTFHSVVSSSVAWRDDPGNMTCSPYDRGGIEYYPFLEWPIDPEDLVAFTDKHVQKSRPSKPYAFIMGHGLWNDLQPDKTYAFVDQLLDGITEAAPYLDEANAFFPRLFLGPNAAGIRKPEIFLARQGNIAITKFELAVGPFVKDRGFDFLGTYNASIQSNNPDGTHGGMKNNLIKAMMVLNWLNSLDVWRWAK